MELPGGCLGPVPERDQQEDEAGDAALRLAEYEKVIDDSGSDLREMLCLFFGVKGADLEAYLALLDIPYATTLELAERAEKDQSNINKRLSNLCDANLAARQLRKRENGGFEFRYNGRPLSETVHWLIKEIEVWSKNVVGEI
ncbi:helix-turn-helix domain-containing protein [Halococcus salsus]|uniref:helix-turn-helix domain-containing protein n=1 Tax=Halococcus salsus TaxID=2162894 RepID=UPI00135B15C6|nr:helix-turn-helix domain-containing protein [Halococcus salsus]